LTVTDTSITSAGTGRSLQDLRRRFHAQFQDAEPSLIDELLDEALHLSSRSRVQQYRVVLAERHVRNELRRRRTT